MQQASEFLEQFKQCINNQDANGLTALNMPDDITGWGQYEQDDYNSLESLHNRAVIRKQYTESVSIDFEPLDVFGNGQAAAVICRCKRSAILKTGEQQDDDNLRVTFYLVEQDGILKIRHGHLSNEWDAKQAFPSTAAPERESFGTPDQPSRLSTEELGPFTELLDKRAAYTEAANLEGLIELHHPNNSNVYWQLHGTVLRGREQYRNHLLFLKERFKEPALKYRQPVVFRNQSLACMSAYCEATYVNDKGARCLISPLRVTYILQEQDNQWLCRHSHWSLPFPEIFV